MPVCRCSYSYLPATLPRHVRRSNRHSNRNTTTIYIYIYNIVVKSDYPINSILPGSSNRSGHFPWTFFVFHTILSKLYRLLCVENPNRAAVSEWLKSQMPIWHHQPHRSQSRTFSSFSMFDEDMNWSPRPVSARFYASRCCHMITARMSGCAGVPIKVDRVCIFPWIKQKWSNISLYEISL